MTLPADLPENWQQGQTISPNGTEVGLSEQHGYNYLMRQVNAAQTAINMQEVSMDGVNQTVDEINSKIGSSGDASSLASVFAKLNSLIATLGDHVAAWTAARAAKMDNLDAKISTRAPASTALSTAQWTNTRAGYLDKLNSGVPITSMPSVIKSVQRGIITIPANSKEASATLTQSVNLNKAVVLYGGAIGGGYIHGSSGIPGDWDARLVLAAANKVTVTRAYASSYTATVPYQVLEFA